MKWITESSDGVIVRCCVRPSSSKTAVVGLYNGALKISLAAPPVDGKANKALRTFIAKKLGLSKSLVSLVAGEKSKNKTVLCSKVTLNDARIALAPVE
jgi:uncharacterized protein (TIGR00251 family)